MKPEGILISLYRTKASTFALVAASVIFVASSPSIRISQTPSAASIPAAILQEAATVTSSPSLQVKPSGAFSHIGSCVIFSLNTKTHVIAGRMAHLPPRDEALDFAYHLVYTQVTSSFL